MTATVEIAQGRLAGSTAGGIEAYRGIPFASAPRFAAPGPAPTWTGTRDATAHGPEAPQDSGPMDAFLGGSGLPRAEECLNLNIWRPTDGENLPVMVFIHGGGFSYGSAGHPCYDGAALARRGQVVVVTLQYRLGVLGLLWHPALADPSAEFAGNWCMQDLLAGLRWVRENIASFGGDADNVTIFGESAGGVAVAQLALSPFARPLIRRAIIQSASPNAVGRTQHEQAADAFVKQAGIAADAAAMRALSVEQVMAAQPAWAAAVGAGRPAPRPMVDGKLLPDWPNAVADRGELRDLDVMLSYCRDEFALMAARMPIPADDDGVRASLRADGLPADLLDAYRAARAGRGQSDDTLSVWLALKTDTLIRVPALDLLARHTGQGGNGYACAVTWESGLKAKALGRALGACHTLELAPLFGTHQATPELSRLAGGAEADAFSNLIQDAWIAFAKTGNPATAATGDWPMFTADRRATMCLNHEARLQDDPWGEERAAMQDALTATDAAA